MQHTETRTAAMLKEIETALAGMPAGKDQMLVDQARVFIPVAIEAERALKVALQTDTAPAEKAMYEAARRANDAALPVLNARACSLAGLIAKSAVSLWCNSADLLGQPVLRFDDVTDQTSARSIVYDLLKMAA